MFVEMCYRPLFDVVVFVEVLIYRPLFDVVVFVEVLMYRPSLWCYSVC